MLQEKQRIEVRAPQVVIIGPAHPLRGGLASYDERLAREFSSKGFNTVIYTFSLQYPSFLFPGTTQYSSEPPPIDVNIKVCINSVNPLNWIQVGNELKRLEPKLVVVRYWLPFLGSCLGTILRRVKKNKTTRIVCIADNIKPHEKRPGDAAFTGYFLKSIDGFITMSEKVLDDLNELKTGKPKKYVPHPLYDNFGDKIPMAEARYKLGIPLDKKILLFFGFIRQYKGLDLLLEALKISIVKYPDLVLLIAGEFYEDEKKYRGLLDDAILENHVILRTNFIADSEVKYYLCAADVVVQPYRKATQSGVTPLAYHFEKPMIVTNVGGLPAMVPDKKVGLIADPNPESLADKIDEYFKMGSDHFLPGLLKEKTKYSWSVMVDEILDIAGRVKV